MPAGHLVADGDLALLRQVHLHQLNHARRQLVRLEDLVDPLFSLLLDARLFRIGGVDDSANALVDLLVLDAQRLEVEGGDLRLTQQLGHELRSRLDRLLHRAGLEGELHRLPLEQVVKVGVAHFVDAQLFLAFETADIADPLAAILFDHLIVDPREDLHVDDDAFHARRDLERRVLDVLRLLAEYGGQQFLLRR